MTIWGKILGGAAGFAVGGPLGMIIGAAAGHAVDRMYKDKPAEGGSEEGPRQDGTKQIAFTKKTSDAFSTRRGAMPRASSPMQGNWPRCSSMSRLSWKNS